MATCKKLTRTKTQVCIGSLNRQIDIFVRAITPPLNSIGTLVDYGEDFTLLATVWSMIETPKGKTIFDEVGTEKVVTNIFYVRRLSSLTSQNWIVYKNNRYDIQMVTDLEENNLFQKIFAIIRGADTKEATKA